MAESSFCVDNRIPIRSVIQKYPISKSYLNGWELIMYSYDLSSDDFSTNPLLIKENQDKILFDK